MVLRGDRPVVFVLAHERCDSRQKGLSDGTDLSKSSSILFTLLVLVVCSVSEVWSLFRISMGVFFFKNDSFRGHTYASE